MKKQPKNKATNKVGEINKLCREKTDAGETINSIIVKFDLAGKIKVLNAVKARGFKVADLLIVLLVIPFYRVRIDNMNDKQRGQKHSTAKKDAYYDLKNNELINWRLVLKLIAQQFGVLTASEAVAGKDKIRAFVADDSKVEKTGHKFENLSKVHDHTIDVYLFGFKILVLGLFDGVSFVPIDFSIHREKGRGSKKERRNQKKTLTKLNTTKQAYKNKEEEIKIKKISCKELKKKQQEKGKIIQKSFQQINRQLDKLAVQLKKIKKQVSKQAKEYAQAQADYKLSLKQHPMCGLKPKQRKEQFKKERIKNSHGYKRGQEVDSKKTDNLLKMFNRAIKSGIKAQYFIADSWFFCIKLVQGVVNQGLHYAGMVPQRENILYRYNDKMVDSKYLYKMNKKKVHRCRKYRSKYIKLTVEYAGLPIQLYFVKMGRVKNWRLIATTDMRLDFIQLFELYQIRWSIEVFFKECKQYLGLGKCESRDFDAQLCSTTLTMVQYILLYYYKRIHYQQKLDGVFEEISYQTMEASIVDKMIAQFIELLDIIAEIIDIEPIELYMMLIQNPKSVKIIKELKLDNFMEGKKAA